jgi:hypothetical protein
MTQAWRKVFNECSVSLLAGETVAITTVFESALRNEACARAKRGVEGGVTVTASGAYLRSLGLPHACMLYAAP